MYNSFSYPSTTQYSVRIAQGLLHMLCIASEMMHIDFCLSCFWN